MKKPTKKIPALKKANKPSQASSKFAGKSPAGKSATAKMSAAKPKSPSMVLDTAGGMMPDPSAPKGSQRKDVRYAFRP